MKFSLARQLTSPGFKRFLESEMPERKSGRTNLLGAIISIFLALLPVAAFAQRATTASRFPYYPSGRIDPSRVNVLSAMDATRTGEFQNGQLTHLKTELLGWQDSSQSLSWVVTVQETADYSVTALLRVDSKVPVILTVSTDRSAISAPFKDDVHRFQSRSGFDTLLRLKKGRNVVTLRMMPQPNDAAFQAQMLALELTRPQVRDELRRAALAVRSDARWMARETFGVGFHWTKRTMPRTGRAKSYDQAVTDFDVERFANQVASTGASFVVLTTSHSDQYIPAPIKALDRILPGRTAKRDLIADLIAALGKRQIKLFLYYHLGPIEDPAWSTATHMWDSDSTRFFNNWRAIIGEMGSRYGEGLAGWWFDDGLGNYYYRSPDWAALQQAAKSGNLQRPVCFNSWSGASATEFQDYYCGEEVAPGGLNEFLNKDGSLGGTLQKGGDGRILQGQFAGLQSSAMFVVESDWVHTKRDTEVADPKWTPQSLANTMTLLKAYGTTPILNMLIYQDGSIAPNSLDIVRTAARIAGVAKVE
jgi:Alpha-L-fucosidase